MVWLIADCCLAWICGGWWRSDWSEAEAAEAVYEEDVVKPPILLFSDPWDAIGMIVQASQAVIVGDVRQNLLLEAVRIDIVVAVE